MKKIIATLLLSISLIGLPQYVNAQEKKFGIKGGLNLTNLNINEAEDEEFRYTYHAGIYAQAMESEDIFGIQAELLLSARGSRADYNTLLGGISYKYKLTYLDLPVLFIFEPGELVEFQGGAYIGYLIGASVERDGLLTEEYEDLQRSNFKSFDYGLAAGVAFNIGHLTIGGRYNLGFQNIAKSESAKFNLGDSRNAYIQLFMGLSI